MKAKALKRTPLYDCHAAHEAKFVPFAGWEMPVQYSGVIPEHKAVRAHAGLFDVSHMGEIFVSGSEAERALNYLTCNNVSRLKDGKAHYSAIINQHGGVVDDIIIYRYTPQKYLICVNASNADKDFRWFLDHNSFDAEFENKSAEYAQIALQGPKALRIFESLSQDTEIASLAYFHFKEMELLGHSIVAARTGYTGEDGLELFTPTNGAADIWQALLETGQKHGLVPVGLGARDSLRLEACYPLHGHELADDISAIESGLGWVVKLKKGEFIGRAVLEQHKKEGAPRALIGFFVDDAGIVREGAAVFNDVGLEIGRVTSGTKTPTVDRALGLALLDSAYKDAGTKVFCEVRTRKLACHVAEIPFYRRAG